MFVPSSHVSSCQYAAPAAASPSLASDAAKLWVLKKNCSVTPRQVLLFFLSLTTASLLIASYFVWRGLWLVLPFTLVNDLALAVALLFYARHALDRECVSLVGDNVRVDVIRGADTKRYDFHVDWLRLEWGGRRNESLWLGQGNTFVNVGTFLTPGRRRRFARELQAALQRRRSRSVEQTSG